MKPIKKLGKAILCLKLERQVRQLRAKHDFQIIAVAGSVGKTSTKLAIAQLLASKQAVRYQDGNYNDRLTVPLIFFDQTEPALFNVVAWWKVLRSNRRALQQDYPYKYVMVELGTDGPGQMAQFAYLKPDVVVLTAISPEHMEYFGSLDAVAAEELAVRGYAKQLLVNVDDVPVEYQQAAAPLIGYAIDQTADYYLEDWQPDELQAVNVRLKLPGQAAFPVRLTAIGKQGAKVSLAAASVAHLLGYDQSAITSGLQAIQSVSGRMQLLAGKQQSTIIDDTYNSSPLAAKAALDVLYATTAPQRIAILGSMNELGDYAVQAHQEIGAYCDPQKLQLLVTIGGEANRELAAVAEQRGCTIVRFDDPIAAGEYIETQLQPGAIILAKGSQNGVFAEEAVKVLLQNPADTAKLVRQSPAWLAAKRQQGIKL